MRERKLVERAVRISGMFVLLSGMGLQPCLASHSYNAASAGVVQVEQQKQKITGCVLDVTGSPLPGASVLVKGAPGRGAITDMDGNFSVEAEQGEQLEISFIGMETQVVTVSAKTRLQITLKEDSKTLDEVVVVGYGTQKKANLTGAVASVSAETLESRPITNLSQGLQGMIGNLNISADNGQRIRVQRSWYYIYKLFRTLGTGRWCADGSQHDQSGRCGKRIGIEGCGFGFYLRNTGSLWCRADYHQER